MSTRPFCLWLALGAAALPVQALELIANGGFEADTGLIQSPDPITAWQSQESGLIGAVASLADSAAPGSGHTTAGAAAGARYALLDLSQAGYTVLYQRFTVGAAGVSGGRLSFDLFATSFAGAEPPELSPYKGLDFESADAMLTARVDILKPGADPLSTQRADITRSYLPTVAYFGSDNSPTGYSQYSHPLTGQDLLAGQTYTLRFALAGNAGQAMLGVDQVSLDVLPVTTPVPEPATWALLLAGFALVGAVARRRA